MIRKYFKLFWLILSILILDCRPQVREPQFDAQDLLGRIEVKMLTKEMGYALGGPVDLSLEVLNLSDKNLPLNFCSTQMFDFVIYQKNKEVWRWSFRKDFKEVNLEKILHVEEIWHFYAEWITKDNQGIWVRGGRYQVEGILNSIPPVRSKRIIIGLAD